MTDDADRGRLCSQSQSGFSIFLLTDSFIAWDTDGTSAALSAPAGMLAQQTPSASAGSGQNLCGVFHTTSPKKKDHRIYGHPLFGCVFHCERIQHLLFRLKTVSVHIWHRSNFASVDCSETREIPDVKNMHLQEGTARSTLEHQQPCALTKGNIM